MQFCMRVGQLSGQVFSPLVNIGLRGVTGAAALSGMHAATDASLRDSMDGACGGSVGLSELGAAALIKAVWWGIRLASPGP